MATTSMLVIEFSQKAGESTRAVQLRAFKRSVEARVISGLEAGHVVTIDKSEIIRSVHEPVRIATMGRCADLQIPHDFNPRGICSRCGTYA